MVGVETEEATAVGVGSASASRGPSPDHSERSEHSSASLDRVIVVKVSVFIVHDMSRKYFLLFQKGCDERNLIFVSENGAYSNS